MQKGRHSPFVMSKFKRFMNIAMVSGLMPVVGIPLPLISYGGTAMLSIMLSFGLLLNMELDFNSKKLDISPL